MQLKELIQKELEVKELYARYGNLSCFDFVKEYERMDELEESIKEDIIKLTDTCHVESIEGRILDNIVSEYGEDALEMDWELYSYDDYLEIYETFQGSEVASQIYYFNEENGKDFLQANYLVSEEHCYYTRDYIAIGHK